MYKAIDLYYEPQEILKEIKNTNLSEMSSFDLAFLSGLIKDIKPKKIVEIGIAAGGTTAVILNTIKKNNLEASVFSIDLSEKYYRDNSKKTGFLLEELKCYWGGNEGINHKLLLGKTIAERIEEVGEEIDCLILDTVHTLPGEIIDFLVCLPYLSQNACVILHDIRDNHLRIGNATNFYATQVLFDVVTGEKYFMWDKSSFMNYPNIGAFKINSNTCENIQDVFSALSITWSYIPDDSMIEKYRECFLKNYNDECICMFDNIFEIQKTTYEINVLAQHYGCLDDLKRKWNNAEEVYIYGTGYYGKLYSKWANINNLKIKKFVVSDDQKIEKENQDMVCHLSEISNLSRCSFVIGVSELYKEEVISNLLDAGFYCIL